MFEIKNFRVSAFINISFMINEIVRRLDGLIFKFNIPTPLLITKLTSRT